MSDFINKHRLLSLFLCIFFCTAFSIGIFCTRTLPHVDEVWSYMLSNKTDSPFLYAPAIGVGEEDFDTSNLVLSETESYKMYFNHWHDSDYYHNAVTVQRGERFLYDRVKYNQTLDVHPPLYYYLLHTICSFFPDTFSWWYAFSINIVFYIGTLIMIFAVSKKFEMNDTNALFAVLFWGISASGTNEVCFLRMYMMLTFFITCITYLNICMIQKFSVKYAAAVFILDILSFLTQYYAYIYVFFITLFYIVYLLYKRRILRGILYGTAILAGVGIAVLMFPAVYKHIFSGIYSPQVTYGEHPSLYQSVTDMLRIVTESYTGLGIDLFYILPVFLAFLFCGHIIILLIRSNKDEKNADMTSDQLSKSFKYIVDNEKHGLRLFWRKLGSTSCKIVLLSMLSAAVLIINVSPDMGKRTVRYLFLLMPLFSVFAVLYSGKLFSVIFRKNKKISAHVNIFQLLLYTLCIFGSHFLSESTLFMRNSDGNAARLKEIFEDSSVVLVDDTHHTQAITPLMMKAHAVYPAETVNDSLCSVIANYDDNFPLYLIVSSAKGTEKAIEKTLKKQSSEEYCYMGYYYFSTDYGHYYAFKVVK